MQLEPIAANLRGGQAIDTSNFFITLKMSTAENKVCFHSDSFGAMMTLSMCLWQVYEKLFYS